MKIKWLGHSCFLLTSSSGVRILTDPFDESVGYKVPAVEADIVTTSHNHSDHNHVQVVKGNFKHLNSPGHFVEKNIEITGVATYHDKEQGIKRGSNVAFIYSIDGLKICHLGDLGHILTNQQINEIGEIDIVLIPIGGTYTIDYREATKVVSLLNPKLVIPMHFKTPVINFPIDSVDKFLANIGSADSVGSQEIELNPDKLNLLAKVIILDYE